MDETSRQDRFRRLLSGMDTPARIGEPTRQLLWILTKMHLQVHAICGHRVYLDDNLPDKIQFPAVIIGPPIWRHICKGVSEIRLIATIWGHTVAEVESVETAIRDVLESVKDDPLEITAAETNRPFQADKYASRTLRFRRQVHKGTESSAPIGHDRETGF